MLVGHHLLLLRDFGPYAIIYINVCVGITVTVVCWSFAVKGFWAKRKDVFFTSATSVYCRSYLTWQDDFRDTFPDSPLPNKSTVSRLVNRFRDTGSVQDRNRSGRLSVLSDNSLDDIRQTLLRSPRKSWEKFLFRVDYLSYGSVHKTTKVFKTSSLSCTCHARI
jgi:hypothetical protein